jgi:hypothetical protein
MRSSSILLVAALGLTSCVLRGGSNESNTESYGDITFYWTFGGHTCNQTPEVALLHITMDGADGPQILNPDPQGVANPYFKCSPASVDGVSLLSFAPGPYTFTIDALDSSNNVLYTTTGTLHVNGSVNVNVDLSPVSTAGQMQVYWRFHGASNAVIPCASTGIADATPVTKVRVRIDSAAAQELGCNQADSSGSLVQGWSWSEPAGSHQVTIDGIIVRPYTDPTTGVTQQQEQVWYSASQTVNVVAGQTTSNVNFDMLPVAAGAHFVPALADATTQAPYTTCAAAGVKAFWIDLVDINKNHTPADGNGIVSTQCDAILQGGFIWDFLPAADTFTTTGGWQGTWTATIHALDGTDPAHANIVGNTTKPEILVAGSKQVAFTLPVAVTVPH